jgi:hypothetical protein
MRPARAPSPQTRQAIDCAVVVAPGLRNTLVRASPPSISLRRLAALAGHVPQPALTPETT